jgi:DMSO/TMAO reductase YedYZ molybdopterin-dependent catalytic subunit
MQILKPYKLILIVALVSVMAFSTVASMQTAQAATTQLFPGEVTQYENQALTPISTYIEYLMAHPDVAIKGTQYIDQDTYKLAVTGIVNNPANYNYTEIVNLDSTLQFATLPCVEGWSVDLLWEGVPVTELLEHAGGAGSEANTVIVYASDGYSSSLPLDYIKENNIMIAFKMNNVTLTPETGWPFFLVAKDQYGYKWVEWITEINVSNDSNYRGYWESRGYPNNATVSGESGGVAVPTDYSMGVLLFGVFIVMAIIVAAFVHRRDQKSRTVMYKQALNKALLY